MKNRAFTLVELMVVASIIAVLAGLMLPALRQALAGAHRTTDVQRLRQLSLAAILYRDLEGGFMPNPEALGLNVANQTFFKVKGDSWPRGEGVALATGWGAAGRTVPPEFPARSALHISDWPVGWGRPAHEDRTVNRPELVDHPSFGEFVLYASPARNGEKGLREPSTTTFFRVNTTGSLLRRTDRPVILPNGLETSLCGLFSDLPKCE